MKQSSSDPADGGLPTLWAPRRSSTEPSPGMGEGDAGIWRGWRTYNLVQNLEADSSSDRSSPRGSSSMSVATSMPGSATDFRFENGRRYHAYAESKYALPNDEQEIDRLELQHVIWIRTFNGRLNLAPLKRDITDVLDIGTGTGTWVIEFAKRYPNARIIGTDLSPIQPEFVRPNCSWLVADANGPWPPEFARRFDYIHTRAIALGVTSWPNLINQAAASLKPGGWLELQEFHLPLECDDGTLAGTALERWGGMMRDGAAATGVDHRAVLGLKDELAAQGFRRVREARLKIPIGPWAKGRIEKELGWMGLRDLHENVLGLSVKLFSALGNTTAQTTELCEHAKRDMMSPKVHSYMPLLIVWAQKPTEEELEQEDTVMADAPVEE